MTPPLHERLIETAALERHLAEAVYLAYGLTEEEIALHWETAPPWMSMAAR